MENKYPKIMGYKIQNHDFSLDSKTPRYLIFTGRPGYISSHLPLKTKGFHWRGKRFSTDNHKKIRLWPDYSKFPDFIIGLFFGQVV